MLHRHLARHIDGSLSGGRSRAHSGWTRDAQSRSRSSGWRFPRVQVGPSRPLGGSKTARHIAPRRGLGLPLPSRSRPLPRPPTQYGLESPARCDLLSLAQTIVRPVPSTSLTRPAREWHSAGYLRALPRQWLQRAESASRRRGPIQVVDPVGDRADYDVRATNPSARTPKPSVAARRNGRSAWYAVELYQAIATSRGSNFTTMVLGQGVSSSSQNRRRAHSAVGSAAELSR
jgi:hypothetical protein